jgi:hypothetical protein
MTHGTGAVSVVLDAGLGQQSLYQVGGSPGPIAVGDLDADSDLDLAVVVVDEERVQLLLNDGSGSFTLGQSLPVGDINDFPAVLAVGDLNADGVPDIAVPVSLGNVMSVLIGKGSAQFAPEVRYPTDDFPTQAFIGDFNGDKLIDILSKEEDDVSLLIGAGDGTFGPPTAVVVPGDPKNTDVGDVDADGDLDFVYWTNRDDAQFVVMLNDSTGQFTASGVLAPSKVRLVRLADVNLDSWLDIVAVGTPGTGGTLGIVSVALSADGRGFIDPHHYATRSDPTGLAVIDVDGDGDGEVLAASFFEDVLSILDNRTILPPTDIVGDLDGNGLVDSLDLNLLLGDFGCTGAACVGDADCDGDTDLADLKIVVEAFGFGYDILFGGAFPAPRPEGERPH